LRFLKPSPKIQRLDWEYLRRAENAGCCRNCSSQLELVAEVGIGCLCYQG
jgi:hypothetical protein